MYMRRFLIVAAALVGLTIATPAHAAENDPNTTPASDSVPDPWTMFVDEFARAYGLTYDQASDKIGAWLYCIDKPGCRPELWQYRRLALKAGWPESALPQLFKYMWIESRGDPNVVYRGTRRRPEHSIGLMQLNTRSRSTLAWYEAQGFTRDNMLDPETNLRAAFALYREAERLYRDGWQPWRR